MEANFNKTTPHILRNIGIRTLEHATRIETLRRVRHRVIYPIILEVQDFGSERYDLAFELAMRLKGLFPKEGEEIREGEEINGMRFPPGSRAWYENCTTLRRVQLGGDWTAKETTFNSGTILEFSYSRNEILIKMLRDGRDLS
jgi:hypothetical protein